MKIIVTCVLMGLLASSAMAEDQPLFRHANAPIEQRVEDLLGRLTLEEKILLCHGRVNEGIAEAFQSGGIPRLNIGRLTTSDGPVGVRNFDKTATTALPSTLSLSCTWDKDAAHAYGRLLAEETLAVHANVIFGPGVNLMRSPLGGRNFEYLSEDPYLSGIMAAHYVEGVQELGIAACAKHLAANDYEAHRHFTSSNMDERTLQEVQMLPFELAARDGGVWTMMAGNNLINGVHVAENRRVVQEIVKDQYSFDGVMLTDWRAAYDTTASALAGTDSTMGFCAYVYDDGRLLEAVKSGKVSESLINDKARRMLRLYVRTGLLDPDSRRKGSLNTPAHQALARQLAAEGMVLLKNDKGLLPLDSTKVRSILITGPGADLAPFGRGSGEVNSSVHVTPLQGLTAALDDHVKITHIAWPEKEASAANPALQKAARSVDLVIFFVTDPVHGEGHDLDNFDLPSGQAKAIAALAEANSKTVVVLLTGEPLSLEPWVNQVPAVLEAWYAGQATGDAIADVLTGKVTPSGKLSCTFGQKINDYACHALGDWPPRLILDKDPGGPGANASDRKSVCAYAADYKEGVFTGYRWFDEKRIAPLFEFGYGLSYTRMALS